jgi:uncharacterized membrane protein
MNQREPRYTTHPRVIAGVVLMASLMLFSTVFAIAITLLGVFMPPYPRSAVVVSDIALDDYFTRTRLLISGAVSLVITVGFWFTVSRD